MVAPVGGAVRSPGGSGPTRMATRETEAMAPVRTDPERVAGLIAKPPAAWTAADLRAARDFLRAGSWYLSQEEVGRLLGLAGDNAGRTVRRWEAGERPPHGGAIVAFQYVLQAVLAGQPDQLIPAHQRALAPLFGAAP